MNNKILWTIVGGIVLLAIAAWILVTGTGVTFRYLGAAMFALLGGGILVGGLTRFRKEEETDQ